jgi:predicted permease
MLDTLRQDLRYGLRTLTRNPGFTFVAVLSLALGIGANTAIFTITNAVFLRSLPVEDAARVMELYTVDHGTTTTVSNFRRTPMSFLNYQDIRNTNDVFSGLSAYFQTGVTLTGMGDPRPQAVELVSANYFDVLGVKPALGRTFRPDEDQTPGGNTVTVLSHSLWTRLFGADAGAIGRTVNLNSMPYTVIGVTPPNFKGTVTVSNNDVAWIPVSMHAQVLAGGLERFFNERRFRMMNVFGRLKPGVQQPQALAAMKTIAARLEREFPLANRERSVEIAPLNDATLGFLPRGQMVVAGVALTAVVGLVLLIASANLANLLLARSAKRSREMGIRAALGAERGRLVRQLLTESLLLSLAGGVGGLLLGSAGCELLWSFRPAFLTPDSLSLRLDWHVFAFTAGVALLTGALFGLAPALRASVPNLSGILNSGGRSGTEALANSPLRMGLVVSEMALALVALIGAGLFIRSMENAQQTNPGFETRNLGVFSFDLGPRQYTPERLHQFLQTALEKVAATPGVRGAALATNPPIGGGILLTILVEGQDQDDPKQRGTLTLTNTVSASYFDTMRIPLLRGRAFTDFDRPKTARVAVVNESMARHFWPGQNAIGKRFRFVNDDFFREVVGVAANTVAFTIGEQAQPIAYLPLEQESSAFVTLHVRTNTNPEVVLAAAMAQVQSLDGNLALLGASSIQQLIGQGLWAPRMGAALFGIFGLLAMLLASVGIYGVMAYMVSQRTNEIGIRMALGASPGEVVRMVVGQSMRLAFIGIAVGVLTALALTRLMGSLLFNVAPYDPLTFAAVSAILAAVALLAGWLPARRAARIDPLRALRQD